MSNNVIKAKHAIKINGKKYLVGQMLPQLTDVQIAHFKSHDAIEITVLDPESAKEGSPNSKKTKDK